MAEINNQLNSTTNQIYEENNKMNWNDLKQFDDMFDIFDDDADTLEYTNEELNQYFSFGHLKTFINEEDIVGDNDLINNIYMKTIENDEQDQEVILSQKVSQLSTNTSDDDSDEEKLFTLNKRRRPNTLSSQSVISKKIKIIDHYNSDDSDIEQDKIPTYLLKTNKSFDYMIKKIMNTTSSITIIDLQQIAILMHHIAALHIQQQIKTIYLQSGTGTLKELLDPELMEVDRRVWPIQVKSEVLKKRANMPMTTVEMNKEKDYNDYEGFVRERLQKINQKIEEYQRQLDEMKNYLLDFSSLMEETITNYVHQYGIKPLQMKSDLKIALLKYDYDAEILERQYLQKNPTEYQIQTAKHLYELKNNTEQSKRELLELKQRVFYNKPPISYNSIETSMLTSFNHVTSGTTNVIETNDEQQLLYKYKNMIQQKKLDTIAIHIARAETKYYQCHTIFHQELARMWQNHRNKIHNQEMSTTLTHLIEQRFTTITDRWRDIYNYKIKYLQNSYDNLEYVMENRQKQMKKTNGFIPYLIIDTPHSLNNKQIELLNRGPTYVPPFQIHISSSCESMDDILKKLYAPLKHQIASLFSKYKIDINIQMELQNKIFQHFKNHFSISIPSHLQQRAMYEMKLVQTIRTYLKENNVILRRTADNMNTFYLGNRKDFEILSNDYLINMNAYEVLFTINNEDSSEQQKLKTKLNQIIQTVNKGLKILKTIKALKEETVDKLLLDTTKAQLPYIYFLPDVSKKNNISLVPFITSQKSATSKVAKYLNRLLRPFADEYMISTTFYNEIDFIQKINSYANEEHRLISTTIFCTIKITNFYTLDTHRNMINATISFLRENLASNKLQQIPIITIQNLLELVLFNNIFVYKNKIYTFIKGGPNSMPLIETLSNIYLFLWQKKILKHEKFKNELFGRYKDQIFFTWNGGSKDELQTFLQTLTQQYPDVHFEISIGSNVYFLNAYIENRHGQLYSRVDHNSIIQKYTLPYVIGHSKLQHSDWLRSALIRAVCYSSLVHDFQQERIYTELTFLVNGYSLLFVECHVQHFFSYFNSESMRYSFDQAMYDKFRSQMFEFMDRQHKLSDKLQQVDDHGQLIRFNYLYEYGPRCKFNKEFRRLWVESFDTHSNLFQENLTFILTTKHLYSLNALLIDYKLSN